MNLLEIQVNHNSNSYQSADLFPSFGTTLSKAILIRAVMDFSCGDSLVDFDSLGFLVESVQNQRKKARIVSILCKHLYEYAYINIFCIVSMI
jgi:hypothetical protein